MVPQESTANSKGNFIEIISFVILLRFVVDRGCSLLLLEHTLRNSKYSLEPINFLNCWLFKVCRHTNFSSDNSIFRGKRRFNQPSNVFRNINWSLKCAKVSSIKKCEIMLESVEQAILMFHVSWNTISLYGTGLTGVNSLFCSIPVCFGLVVGSDWTSPKGKTFFFWHRSVVEVAPRFGPLSCCITQLLRFSKWAWLWVSAPVMAGSPGPEAVKEVQITMFPLPYIPTQWRFDVTKLCWFLYVGVFCFLWPHILLSI